MQNIYCLRQAILEWTLATLGRSQACLSSPPLVLSAFSMELHSISTTISFFCQFWYSRCGRGTLLVQMITMLLVVIKLLDQAKMQSVHSINE